MRQHRLSWTVDVVPLKFWNNPVHKPLPVEKQVTILYALTHGFLDTVPVDDIVRFEEEFHAFFDAQHPEILETIRDTKDLPEEAILDAAITEFLNQTSFQ